MGFLITSSSITSVILILLGLSSTRAQPTAATLNSQTVSLQTNQLTNGDLNVKPVETTVGQFHFRNPVSQQQQQPYTSNQPGYQPTSANYPPSNYGRDVQSSPFFGLASNGEIQLSAYFSQLFWGFVAVTVTIAVIVYLVRLFFPSATIGGLIKKASDSGAARAIDLDKITNIVYGALDSYGKWALKEIPKVKTR